MPQFKTFILAPQDARGLITSRSEQTLGEYLNSLSEMQNFVVLDGAWKVRYGDIAASLGSSADNKVIWGGHVFNSINSASAAATPATVILLLAGGAKDGTGTATLYRMDTNAAVTVSGVNFTVTAPFELFAITCKNRCFVAGRSLGASVVPTVITKYPSATSYPWGVSPLVTDLSYDAITNATNATTKVFFTANGAGVTSGSANITKAAGSSWDTAWAGMTVVLDTVSYKIVSATTTTMVIDPVYAVPSVAPTPVNIRVQYGELSWAGPGPQYAIAKYNPSTGHCSNIGSLLTVSESDIGNVRIKLTIPVDNDPVYTRIVIFRTALQGGSSLLPLQLDPSHGGTATIDNTPGSNGRYMVTNNASGTKTYVDFQPDPKLTAILGYVVGPTANNPPPADIKYMAFWDGRIWVTSVSAPYRLQFTSAPGQTPLGVAEECFPALNYRDISADDGFITGLRVIGSSLLVSTERFLFVIDGSSEATYRMTRISSRGAGVDFWAMDEHPGDSTEQSASAVYLSRDKRLWRQYPGGRIEDIGWAIQDKLDLINTNQLRPAIVRVIQVRKHWMMLLGIRVTPLGQSERYSYLAFDFDHQTWSDIGYGGGIGANSWSSLMPWGSVITGIYYVSNVSGIPFATLGADGTGQLYSFMASTDIPNSGVTLSSQWIDFGDKAAKKALQFVNVHTNMGAENIIVYALFDGSAGVYTLLNVPDTSTATSPRYAGADVVRYVLPSDQGHSQFHTVKIQVTCNDVSVNERIDKVEIGYTVEQTGISGGSN